MSRPNPTRSYVPCPESAIPAAARFDTPAANQGQIVTVSYADWPPSRYEADAGSRFRRTFDASDRSTSYARLDR